MHCAACGNEVSRSDETTTGDVCPHCRHFVHPTRLSGYEDLELIKRGGMGAVYRARHARLGTVVAIKLVQRPDGPDTIAERFDREAKLAAKIPHPGVVRVFDSDCQDGRLYLVMEFVEGSTLRECIRRGRLDISQALDIAAQLADVLHAAHEQGIVHRDVKPENVMIDRADRVRVLDFGISRVISDDEPLTRTGEILGTPEYIAPEQILDVPEAVDRRADIHAVGVLLYELLTGVSPFAGQNLFQVLKYVESLTPDRPSRSRAEIPEALDDLVLSALAKDKDRRPASAAILAERVREIAEAMREPDESTRRMRLPLLRASGLVALGLAMGWILTSAISPARRVPTVLDAGASRVALLVSRGLDHKRTGAMFLAADCFRQAHEAGNVAAGRQWRIAWLYMHRLYPALMGGPMWLAERYAGFTPGDDAFERGLAALARNEWAAAEQLLTTSDASGTDRTVLIALCRHLLGKPVQFEVPESGDAATWMMAAALRQGNERVEVIKQLEARIDRLAPMRYFLGMALAKQARDPKRLRAASELALVAGDASLATSVFLACRITMEPPVDASYLLELSREPAACGAPGIQATRCMLALAARDGALLRAGLLAIPETPDPALTEFQSLRPLANSSDDQGLLEACGRRLSQDHAK